MTLATIKTALHRFDVWSEMMIERIIGITFLIAFITFIGYVIVGPAIMLVIGSPAIIVIYVCILVIGNLPKT